MFETAKVADQCSFAPMSMSISAIEASLRDNKKSGSFGFPYPPEIAAQIRKAINSPVDLHIKLTVPQFTEIVNSVRNIILNWTLEMEKQGVLGTNLAFNAEERIKSEAVTAQTVNNIHIGQVGSFVQNAENSTVQGGVDSTFNLTESIRDLLGQIERALPTSDLPTSVQEQAADALSELRVAVNAPSPDASRLRRGVESLKNIMEHASGDLLATGAVALIDKLLQYWPG